jgi:hypothetical protein
MGGGHFLCRRIPRRFCLIGRCSNPGWAVPAPVEVFSPWDSKPMCAFNDMSVQI